jgi:hypothetical protein
MFFHYYIIFFIAFLNTQNLPEVKKGKYILSVENITFKVKIMNPLTIRN